MAGYADDLAPLAKGEPHTVPAVSDDPQAEAGMPGQEPYDYYGTERSLSPHWRNAITRLSSLNLGGFDAVAATRHLQQTPSLIVHGTVDGFCSPVSARRAFEMIDGDKRLEWIETSNHIELYDSEPHVARAVELVADRMHRHLDA